MKKWVIAAFVLTLSEAQAQAPYAGLQMRPIKALSEQQVADLSSGRGMGLALAAELNGYPGPSHVLELADKLDLTTEQRARPGAIRRHEGGSDASGGHADCPGERTERTICKSDSHAGKSGCKHGRNCRYAGEAPRVSFEVSSIHVCLARSSAAQGVRRVAGRRGRPSRTITIRTLTTPSRHLDFEYEFNA
jgi:hypothetical protein